MQRAMVYYDENTRPLITNFKFRDKTENASFLAKWLYAAGQDIWQQGADLLVPVPLHAKRLRHRRFNQSALMCKELSRLTGIPVEYNSLVRSINTKPQVECSGHTRISNIKGAFKVTNTKAFEGKRIVIIDDVITTGSTLQECGLEIKKSGASEVNALVVARVIK
jgi:ComF family protein